MAVQGSLFIFGLGYSSAGIARQAQKHGWCVTSTARKPARFAPLQLHTHKIIRFDPAAQQPLDTEGTAALQAAQYVLTSIPPVAAKLYDPVLAAQHKAIRQVAEPGQLALGYLSSTGVYGDWGGDWVNESSETKTATARGLLRLEAEQAWVQLAQQLQLPLTIFRLGGIYGPNRSVLTNLQAKGPVRASAQRRSRQRFTSRCHVADVAQAVLADMQRRTHAAALQAAKNAPLLDIVNVVDDEPAPRGEVEACAQLLLDQRSGSTPQDSSEAGQPMQQQSEPPAGQQQQQQRKRAQEPLEEKRVRNAKLKQLLSVHGSQARLVAPTYREGLQLLLDGVLPFEQADLDCLGSL